MRLWVARPIVALLLALVTVGCLPSVRHIPITTSIDPKNSRLPMEYRSGEILALANVDSTGPYRFKLDTGASVMAITASARDRLKLETRSLPWRLTGAGESRWKVIESAQLTVVSLGATKFEGIDCLVLDGVEDDGFLGNGLFDAGVLVMDFPNNSFNFRPTAPLDLADPNLVPIVFEGGVPIFEARVDDQTARFTLDTGFNGWIRLPIEWRDRFEYRSRPYAVDVQTIHRVRREEFRQIDGVLRVGTHDLLNPIVVFGTGSPLFGTRAMEYFEVTLDAKNRRVGFARNSTNPIVIPPIQELMRFGSVWLQPSATERRL